MESIQVKYMVYRQTDGQRDRRMDRQEDGRTDRYRWINGQMYKRTDRGIDVRLSDIITGEDHSYNTLFITH